MQTPMHIKIINKIPGYTTSLKNRSKKRIQEVMREHNYDEDFIEAIDDRFCQGFSVARDIIIEMLETQYWNQFHIEEKQNKTPKNGS